MHIHRTTRIAYAPIALAALAAAVCSALAAPAHAAAAGCVDVEIRNVRAGQGSLMVAAYDAEAGFGKQPASSQQLRAPADATVATLTLCGLAGDKVALTIYQDVNANGKLDTNAMGIPIEPWGASGRVAPMAGPSWAATSVPVDGKPVVVTLTK